MAKAALQKPQGWRKKRAHPGLQKRLLPGRIDWLADQELGVGAGARSELLRAAIIDFGDVEVPFLIHAEAVHAPEASREIAPSAPGIEQVSLEVVVQHLGTAAVEGPQSAIRAD